MANTIFSKDITINDNTRTFLFQQTFYGNKLKYHVDVDGESAKKVTFRMYRDEEGQWKIHAQALPMWVHENELKRTWQPIKQKCGLNRIVIPYSQQDYLRLRRPHRS